MTLPLKKEFSAVDASPVVLYAKESATSEQAYPVLITSSGCLSISTGFDIPEYDYIALGYSGNNVNLVQYYLGGAGGALMATLTLTYSGNNITSVART